MTDIDIRKGMPSARISKEEFTRRYRARFTDPAFHPLSREISAIVDAAWDGYNNSRKSPHTHKAGNDFADPNYNLATDWIDAREAILAAQRRHDDPRETPRILLINGSSRSENTCPGEMSKTWRLVKLAQSVFEGQELVVDILDLSLLASEFGRTIHPCKACVSTSMPLCHWPCSCYPNYSLGQTDDWMNDIYPLWVAAHGIMIVAPVNWYQAPTGLKAMIDRLVCADGGNPDPTTTHGKNAAEAKAIEIKGWNYPKHLDGRHFAVVVHGDTVGAEGLRHALTDWLTDMSLVSASRAAELDGYIGYQKPYATSHQALDEDNDFQLQIRNAARALANAVMLARAGKYQRPDEKIEDPNPK